MSKKITFTLLSIFIFIISFSFGAEDKDKSWLQSFIERTSLYSAKSMSLLSGKWGRRGADAHLEMAIHNINNHLKRVARLQNRGLTNIEIQALLNADLAEVAGPKGSIKGKITEKGGGKVQSSVSIYAYDKYGRSAGYDYILANKNPNYKLKNLAPGKYYVLLRSRYYQNRYYRNTTDWKKAKLVRVSKNKATQNINFVLEPKRGTGSIAGQVRRKDNTPMMDCDIYVYDQDFNMIKSTKTDADGQYIADKLPAGDFKIQCSYKESGEYLRSWYRNTSSYMDATVVSLTKSQSVKGIDFILEYGGSIEGKIIGSNGKPIKDRRCYITAYDMNQNFVDRDYTDEQGKFSLPALLKGKYKLKISYYGEDNNLGCWYRNAKNFKSAPAITVIPNKKKTIKVKLKKGGEIKGRVIDFNGKPLSYPCEVKVYDDGYGYVKFAYPDQNGFFKVGGLESGRYKVYAEYNDYSGLPGPQPASEWYGGYYYFHEAPFVRVKVRKTTRNINFSLKQGGSISGTLVDNRGYSFDYSGRGRVSAYNKMFDYVNGADVDGWSGSYEIKGLPSGEYVVRASGYGDDGYMSEFYDNKQNFETAEKVSVTAPNTTGNIDFRLEYDGIIQGFVTDAKKNRLTSGDHFIRPIAYDAQTGEYADFGETNFVGGYQLKVMAGTYKISVVSFYANWLPEHHDFMPTYHLDQRRFNDPDTRIFSVSSGSSNPIKTLAMKKTKGAITGTIYNLNTGLPVTSGVYAILVYDEYGYLAGSSHYGDYNAPINGEYRLCGLGPGQYYLFAFSYDEGMSYQDIPIQWYNGLEVTLEESIFLGPKVNIPAGALAVSVGTTAAQGIDFYLNLPKKK